MCLCIFVCICPLVKVLWSHHGVEEATWEHEAEVRKKYPDFLSMFESCDRNVILILGCILNFL